MDLPVRYGVRGQSVCMGAKWQGRAGDQTHSTDAYSAIKTTLTPHAGVLGLPICTAWRIHSCHSFL